MLRKLETRDDLDEMEDDDIEELQGIDSKLQGLRRQQLGSAADIDLADVDAGMDEEDPFSLEDFMEALDEDPELGDAEKMRARLAVQGMYNASSESVSGGASEGAAAEVYDPALRGETTTGSADKEGQYELRARPQRPQAPKK